MMNLNLIFPITIFSMIATTTPELHAISLECFINMQACADIIHTTQAGAPLTTEQIELLREKMMEYMEARGLEYDEPFNLRTVYHFYYTNSVNLRNVAQELVRRGAFRR